MNLKDYHIPPCHCPRCGRKLDGALEASPGERGPMPGDFTVCIYCAEVLTFAKDMSLHVVPPALVREGSPDLHRAIAAVMKAMEGGRK